MSFEPGLIAEVKAADPKLPRGLVAAGRWRTGPRYFRETLALGVDFISYAIDDLPRRCRSSPIGCSASR